MKDLSNNIKEFEIFPYKVYVRRRPKHKSTDGYFYLAIQIAKCMMRSDALNFHVDPVRIETTGTQHIIISYVLIRTRANQKISLRTKYYRKSILWIWANHNVLSSMKVLRRRANQEAFTKVLTQTKKTVQLVRQVMRNLQ